MCFNIEYSCHTITNIKHGWQLSLQLMTRGEIPMFVRCTKFVQVHISFIICIIVIVLVNTLRSFKCCICFLYNKYKMVEIYMNILYYQEGKLFLYV